MITRRVTHVLTFSLFLMLLSINPCQALEEYSLEIKVTVSTYPFLAFQSVSPIFVTVEISNIGNNTFNGTLWIEGKTEDGAYSPLEFPISNLTKDIAKTYSSSFRTDDVGTYWFTIKIEPNQTLSSIKLYEGSILKDEGFRVSLTKSTFIHSFSEFIAILAIVIGAIVAVIIAIYQKKSGRRKK